MPWQRRRLGCKVAKGHGTAGGYGARLRSESRPRAAVRRDATGMALLQRELAISVGPSYEGHWGVPDEQSRPGPWKPEAGGSHSPTVPWPHNRIPALPLARTCPPAEILVWFRHTKRAGPAQRPALSGQRGFFGPRIELKGCDRATPARWASEWLHVPPRPILQALPFAQLPGVDNDRGGAATARLVARGSSSARLLCSCPPPAAPP